MIDSELIQLRHDIHNEPEVGFEEKNTIKKLKTFFKKYPPSNQILEIGNGIIFIYENEMDKDKAEKNVEKTIVLFRSELDGLPIIEQNGDLPYKSKNNNGHFCGHDGHMAMYPKYIFFHISL